MASITSLLLLSPLLPFFTTILVLLSCKLSPAAGCYSAIIGFGASLVDTGNFLISQQSQSNRQELKPYGRLPYGETYFGCDSGRYSDGRIVIDFIAEAMGIPKVPPYLAEQPSDRLGFRQGVNFAVGGATAMEVGFYAARGMLAIDTNYSLGVQVGWFKELLPSLCSSQIDCKYFLERTLFIVGEIGANDYHTVILGSSPDELPAYIPKVIGKITATITELIELGARTLVVPGMMPLGCSPGTLTIFDGLSRENVDPVTGCVRMINEYMEYHNQKLQVELDRLQESNPHVTLIYADYYGAIMRIMNSPQLFGFENTFVACCGGEGPYNFDATAFCGTPGTKLCEDPSKYVSWDGIHLTEAAYKIISAGFLVGPYAIPSINNACLNIEGSFVY